MLTCCLALCHNVSPKKITIKTNIFTYYGPRDLSSNLRTVDASDNPYDTFLLSFYKIFFNILYVHTTVQSPSSVIRSLSFSMVLFGLTKRLTKQASHIIYLELIGANLSILRNSPSILLSSMPRLTQFSFFFFLCVSSIPLGQLGSFLGSLTSCDAELGVESRVNGTRDALLDSPS